MIIKYYRVKDKEHIFTLLKRELLKHQDIILAIIYGSILYRDEVRDIDIAIYTKQELPLKKLLLISHELEKKTRIPVDLAPIDKLPASLKYRVLVEGKPLIIKDKKLFNELLYRAFSELNDLRIKIKLFSRRPEYYG
ncbi:MAG: hypothetical protein B6U89_03800 [Desulfurococcales archaeon ex4484_58]|nr:MAG: hypothetical protein B6U89_03800 [Desulfurococcales archaeon ex4484_58]